MARWERSAIGIAEGKRHIEGGVGEAWVVVVSRLVNRNAVNRPSVVHNRALLRRPAASSANVSIGSEGIRYMAEVVKVVKAGRNNGSRMYLLAPEMVNST